MAQCLGNLWKSCSLIRVLISGLILVGKAWTLNLAIAFVKGVSFFSWLQGRLWKSLLQLWTLRTNLLKWTGPSHGPVPWKFVEKLFFNRGLISRLIVFAKAWTLNLAIAFVKGFSFFSWLQDQLWKSLLQLWTLENKPTKVNRTLSWPSCFFSKGFISGLIVFRKAWTLNLAIGFSFVAWLQDQLWKSLLQ